VRPLTQPFDWPNSRLTMIRSRWLARDPWINQQLLLASVAPTHRSVLLSTVALARCACVCPFGLMSSKGAAGGVLCKL